MSEQIEKMTTEKLAEMANAGDVSAQLHLQAIRTVANWKYLQMKVIKADGVARAASADLYGKKKLLESIEINELAEKMAADMFEKDRKKGRGNK